jgi:hypothetical protein
MLSSNPQMLGACILLFVLWPTLHLFALKYYDTVTVYVCVCVRVWYEGMTLCCRCDK